MLWPLRSRDVLSTGPEAPGWLIPRPSRSFRESARIIVIDDRGRILLGIGADRPGDGSYLFTVGGGVDPGESVREAGCREVAEEVGLIVEPDELHPLRKDHTVFDFTADQPSYFWTEDQLYFALAVNELTPTCPPAWTEIELEFDEGFEWFTRESFNAWVSDVGRVRTAEGRPSFYPADLPELWASAQVILGIQA